MNVAEEKLEAGMIVELRPGIEEVYPRALAGMRGIVRGTKDDEYGFPQAFIEWDKEHWRYNGERDGWTFASHFRPIEGGGSGNREIIGAEVHDVPQTPPRIPSEAEERRIEHYIEAISQGFERASESEGFFLITLKRDPNNMLKMDLLASTVDEELKDLPGSDLLRFAQEEMKRIEES